MLMAICGGGAALILLNVLHTVVSSSNSTVRHPATPPMTAEYSSNSTVSHPPTSTLKNCSIFTSNTLRDSLGTYIQDGYKLIELEIDLVDYPSDYLEYRLKNIFQPYHWVKSTNRAGQRLLVLGDTYGVMSLFLLRLGVVQLSVRLTDSPNGCLSESKDMDMVRILLVSILNDFAPVDINVEGTQDHTQQVCHRKVRNEDGTAIFVYTCCHWGPENDIVCADVVNDVWLDILDAFIVILKVVVFLFSPFFIPKALYIEEQESTSYTYYQPTATSDAPIKLRVLFRSQRDSSKSLTHETLMLLQENTSCNSAACLCDERRNQNDDAAGRCDDTVSRCDDTVSRCDDKVVKTSVETCVRMPIVRQVRVPIVRLDQQESLESLKQLTRSCMPNTVYDFVFHKVQLRVKPAKLLDERSVPVGLFHLLFYYLIRCQLRHVAACAAFCRGRVVHLPYLPCTWFTCSLAMSRLLLLFVLSIPSLIRVLVYCQWERNVLRQKSHVAAEMHLSLAIIDLHGYLLPAHIIFLVTWVVLVADLLLYRGILNKATQITFKALLRDTMRNVTSPAPASACSNMTRYVLQPCAEGGVGRTPCCVWRLLNLLIQPLGLLYRLPTVRLSCRLFFCLLVFVCPKRFTRGKMAKKYRLEKLPNHVTIRFLSLFACLVTLCCLTLLLMDTTIFFVEVFVHLLLGIIINAEIVIDYFVVVMLAVWYGQSVFNGVHTKYLNYHKAIHKLLLEKKKEDVDLVASRSCGQNNNAFSLNQNSNAPKIVVKNGKLRWETQSMLMFLDHLDVAYTPVKYFFNTTKRISHWGAPGPVRTSISKALYTLVQMLLALLFVFITVMAFGESYGISSTNRLLATVVGGLLPFLFYNVFVHSDSDAELDTDNVQFKYQFQESINLFRQSWPVYDIESTGLTKREDMFGETEDDVERRLVDCISDDSERSLERTCLQVATLDTASGERQDVESNNEEPLTCQSIVPSIKKELGMHVNEKQKTSRRETSTSDQGVTFVVIYSDHLQSSNNCSESDIFQTSDNESNDI